MFEPAMLVPIVLIIAAVLAYISHKNDWKITKYF